MKIEEKYFTKRGKKEERGKKPYHVKIGTTYTIAKQLKKNDEITSRKT